MKVAHTADIHFCAKHLKWVRLAMDNFIDTAIAEKCDVAVLAGDIFDHAVSAHEPAFHEALSAVIRLSKAMPVIMPYGTLTHDHPGSLEAFEKIGDRVHVASVPTVVDLEVGTFFVLPGLNKALPEVADEGASKWARDVLSRAGGWFEEHKMPAALVTHGTVTGCVTESNFAMVSPDHEFSLDTLALANCEAVMLGHIHKHQSFRSRTPSGLMSEIVYPGSLARLVYGHMDPVGFVIWDIEPGKATWKFHESPSRQLVDISFEGPPDMANLKRIAADCAEDDAAVRLRYSIDEEHAGTVDKRAIRELFAHCDELKIEAKVSPVQRVRAEGIATAMTLHDKLRHWAATTDSMESFDPLAQRLEMLQTQEDDKIIGGIR